MISVIMPTHNKAVYLNITLLAYRRQTYKNFEIVLIDDGSTDNTKDIYEKNKEYLNIKYIYQKKSSVSKARNMGLDYAKGDIVVFADDDRIPCENYLFTIASKLNGRPKTVLIGYKEEVLTVYHKFTYQQEMVDKVAYEKLGCKENALIEQGKVLVSEGDILNEFASTMKKMFLRVPYDNYEFVIDKFGCEMENFHLGWAMATTANLAFCREGAEVIRFDERYVGWGVEDIDYAYQLKESGFVFFFCKEAINYHQKHMVDFKKRETLKRNMSYFSTKYPNLDVFFYYQSFQSKDRSFDYVKGNDVLIELRKPGINSGFKCLVEHLQSVWKIQQKEMLEQYIGG